jgi:predicted MPP superfamily phosphohydrolase
LGGAIALVHLFRPRRHGVRRAGHGGRRETARSLDSGLRLVQCELTLESLPPVLAGLRLLLLSDLHCSSVQCLGRLREHVSALAATEPDIVAILGDFGEKADLLPDTVAALASLPARIGSFCVRGNHDFEGGRAGLLADLLAGTEIHLLDGRTWCGDRLTLLGVEAPWAGGSCLPAPGDGFVLALSHTPDNVFALERSGVRLVVSGHTHGGHLRLPGLGPVLVPSRYGTLLASGSYRVRGTELYVTRGFGYFSGTHWGHAEAVQLTLGTEA